MLQKIHERVQGVIAWLLVILIVVTFTLWGVNYYLESHANVDVEAVVNGQDISKTDFMNTYDRLKRQAERGNHVLGRSAEKKLRAQALKELIFTQTVVQGAQEAGYLVTREQAQTALLQIPQFQEDGQFSEEKFQQALNASSYTPSIFVQRIQEGLTINQQRFSFAGTVFVLPQEEAQFVQLLRQTRDASWWTISAKSFESQVQVTNGLLENYYKSHKNDYQVPAQIKIDYINVSIADMMSNISVSSKAMHEYYESNLETYTEPQEWKWAHILIRVPENADATIQNAANVKALEMLKKIKKDSDFDVMVKKSDDILSISQKGVTGWVTQGAVPQDILTALTSLSNNQVYPKLIHTQYGYEIIKRVDLKKLNVLPFDVVKPRIEIALKSDKAEQAFADMGDNLTNLSYQHPNSLLEVANQLNLPLQHTVFFSRAGLKDGIASHKEVIHAAFSDDVLKEGNNSNLISLQDTQWVVLRVQKYLPESVKSFEQVKNEVKSAVIQQEAQKLAKVYGKKLLSRFIQNSNKPVTLVDGFTVDKLHVFPPEAQLNIHREEESLNESLLHLIFRLASPHSGLQSWGGIALPNGDYVIAYITKVTPGSMDTLEPEEQKLFTDEMEAALGIVDYDLYVDGLMKNAKVIKH